MKKVILGLSKLFKLHYLDLEMSYIYIFMNIIIKLIL